MKQILIMLGATVVLGTGLVWLAGPSKSPATATVADTGPSSLTVPEKSYDFGTISMKNGKVSYDFKVQNTGNKPLTVTKMFTSCMCTEAFLVNGAKESGPFGMPGHAALAPISESIAAGASAVVRVVFDPAAHGPAGVGTISRVVTVQTDTGAPLEFRFRAVVTP